MLGRAQAPAPDLPERSRPRAPCIVTRLRPDSDELVFAFCGHGDKLFMDPTTFLATTGMLERNLVIFRDPRRAFYLLGLEGEQDGPDGLLRFMQELREEMPGVRRVHCLGTSAGASGAILYGHALGADEVLAFSPKTLFDVHQLAWRPIRRSIRHTPRKYHDLREFLTRHNGRTRYRIYYSKDFPRDAEQAERMADVPGVTLLPRPGENHNVLDGMLESGELGRLLDPAGNGTNE